MECRKFIINTSELEAKDQGTEDDFNLNSFCNKIVLDTIPNAVEPCEPESDSKIRIPLSSLNLNSNNCNEFPPTQKQYKSSKRRRDSNHKEKENFIPKLDFSRKVSEGISFDRSSLGSPKASSVKLAAHSKSAFEPFKHSKTTDCDSSTLNDSMSLISKLEDILSTKHQPTPTCNSKMDYTLCLSLVSSVWSQSPSYETKRLCQKYGVEGDQLSPNVSISN